jgi:biotin--protein ligase
VIYTDIITSTMKVVTGKSLRHGMTVIARRQTDGKGRGRNIWLSPEGCALFTVQLVVNMDSQMGRRLSLLQHLAALSVILAVPNHREINLRVKWPNDIYAGDQKIGGVLVESRLEGKEAVVNVGVGFNVSNAYPTMCLNSLLFPDFEPPPPSSTSTSNTIEQDKINWSKKGYWTTEKLIAKSLTELEKLVEKVEKPLVIF